MAEASFVFNYRSAIPTDSLLVRPEKFFSPDAWTAGRPSRIPAVLAEKRLPPARQRQKLTLFPGGAVHHENSLTRRNLPGFRKLTECPDKDLAAQTGSDQVSKKSGLPKALPNLTPAWRTAGRVTLPNWPERVSALPDFLRRCRRRFIR